MKRAFSAVLLLSLALILSPVAPAAELQLKDGDYVAVMEAAK